MEIFKNVKKIYTSEILSIVGIILTAIGGFMLLGTGYVVEGATFTEEETAALGSVVLVMMAFAIVGLVLLLVAAIMQLVGITALKDKSHFFEDAFAWIIVTFVAELVAQIFSTNELFSNIAAGFSNITSILMIYYICNGCADVCHNQKVTDTVKKVNTYIICAAVLSCATNILSAFGVNPTITSVASTVFTVLYNIFYLVVLSRSVKALRA